MFYSFYGASESSHCIVFLSDIVLSLRSFNSLLTPMIKVLYCLVFVPKVNTIVGTSAFANTHVENKIMITMLIGVDNILNKITKFVLVYICYMFIILCYVFLFTSLSYMELCELYQHLKIIPCYI